MKTLCRSLTLSAFLTLCSLYTYAQQANINGRVQHQQEPVAFATVALLSTTDFNVQTATITDSLGQFSLQSLPAAKYRIMVKFVGYETYISTDFILAEGQSLQLSPIELNARQEQLQEVQVTATKNLIEQQPGKLVYNVAQDASLAGTNLKELLETAPGVTTVNDLRLNGRPNVQVLVNGRKRGDGSLQTLLQSVNTASIERLELMSNPGVEFDAAGTGGIINIILKKNEKEGFNGKFSGSLTQGHELQPYGSFGWNYKKKILNLYGDLNYNRYRSYTNTEGTVNYSFGPATQQQMAQRQKIDSKTPSALLGVDLQLSPKHQLGMELWGMRGDSEQRSNLYTLSFMRNSGSELNRQVQEQYQDFDMGTANLNYTFNIDSTGRSLKFDANYVTYDNRYNTRNSNEFYNYNTIAEPQADYTLYGLVPTESGLFTSQLDYLWPLGKPGTQLDAGLKYSRNKTRNDVRYDLLQEGRRTTADSLSSLNSYTENVSALYLQLTHPIGSWSLQLGLRGEYTSYDLSFISSRTRLGKDYLSLFPNFSLSHQVGEGHNFSYSFSRRIQRQPYEYMNPYVQVQSEYSQVVGNPKAKPSFAYNFDLQHSYNYTYITTLSYAYTHDVLLMLNRQIPGTTVTQLTYGNFASMQNISLSFNAPLTIKLWWTMTNYLSVFANKYQNNGAEGFEEYTKEYYLSASLYHRHNFKLPKDWSIALNASVNSGQVMGMAYMKSNWSANGSITKSLWEGRGSVALSARDIFNTNEFRLINRFSGAEARVNSSYDSQRLSLSFNYSLGNNKLRRRYLQKSSEGDTYRLRGRSQ